MKAKTYTTQREQSPWYKNSLEGADEDISKKFDGHLVGKFLPYLARYRSWTLASIVLMLLYTVFNLANPYLIGVAIDRFISHNDLRGLAGMDNVLGWTTDTLPSQFRHVHPPAKAFAEFL